MKMQISRSVIFWFMTAGFPYKVTPNLDVNLYDSMPYPGGLRTFPVKGEVLAWLNTYASGLYLVSPEEGLKHPTMRPIYLKTREAAEAFVNFVAG